MLSDHPKAVIDFGAGIGPFENTQYLKRNQTLFESIPNIFLLVPSRDTAESLRILRERDANPPADLKFDINEHFLQHSGYQLLAKHIVYTQGTTPEQSFAEVISLLS